MVRRGVRFGEGELQDCEKPGRLLIGGEGVIVVEGILLPATSPCQERVCVCVCVVHGWQKPRR
jgi:hypothetical protein